MLRDDFHEVWWIATAAEAEWGGLRIAHFRMVDDVLVAVITGEPPARMGPRIWHDIERREGWRKVEQIAMPTDDQIRTALAITPTKIV